MPKVKSKVSVSLDEDLVEKFEREDQSLSAQVNVAVLAELERRRHHRLLVELLDQLDAERGRRVSDREGTSGFSAEWSTWRCSE